MSFSKGQYEKVASVIADCPHFSGYKVGSAIDKQTLVARLANMFEVNSPNFDRDRFTLACYGTLASYLEDSEVTHELL